MVLPMETLHRGGDPTCDDCHVTPALEVLMSAAGYYIGTKCNCGPFSRESGYYKTRTLAEQAMARGGYER